MSFSPKRNYWFIPQNRLKIPQEFEVLLWWCPVIYREFVLEKVRDVFPSHIAMRFFKERPVTSKRLLVLEFIQRHCHTLMLRINFRFTWRLVLVGRLHGMADFDSRHIPSTPPVWIRTCFFLIRFCIQNTPLEWLQASWCQPNLWLKDGLHGAPLVINMFFWPGDCHKMLQEPLRLNEEETYNKVKNNWQHEAQGRQFYICINIYFK